VAPLTRSSDHWMSSADAMARPPLPRTPGKPFRKVNNRNGLTLEPHTRASSLPTEIYLVSPGPVGAHAAAPQAPTAPRRARAAPGPFWAKNRSSQTISQKWRPARTIQ